MEQINASGVTDSDARIIFANTAFTQTTGYSLRKRWAGTQDLESGLTRPEPIASGSLWPAEGMAQRAVQQEEEWRAVLGGTIFLPIVDAEGRTHYLAVMDTSPSGMRKQKFCGWPNGMSCSDRRRRYLRRGPGGVSTFINPAPAILGFGKEEVLGRTPIR